MKALYNLQQIDTKSPDAVAIAVRELYGRIFPENDSSYIEGYFKDVEKMFLGEYKGYQAMDTAYHDLEHTMQATLCFIRLMTQRQQSGVGPSMTQRDFNIGLLGILFHDLGYLKKASDNEGTGAKFTFVHEHRSCEFADVYLTENGWPKDEIFAVQHLISCTGPRSIIDSIPFSSTIERVMGEALCTADYLGQMSDPGYVDKLPVLFSEFEESDDFRGIEPSERLFKSVEQLIHSTPVFWRKAVIPKLEKDCHGLYRYLADPYPEGINPYIECVEKNVEIIQGIIDSTV